MDDDIMDVVADDDPVDDDEELEEHMRSTSCSCS